MKGNQCWRYTHFPLNHDCGRKGNDSCEKKTNQNNHYQGAGNPPAPCRSLAFARHSNLDRLTASTGHAPPPLLPADPTWDPGRSKNPLRTRFVWICMNRRGVFGGSSKNCRFFWGVNILRGRWCIFLSTTSANRLNFYSRLDLQEC